MPRDLFRKEVMEAKQESRLGAIALAQPLGSWFLTAAAAIIAIGVIVFLVFGSYARRASVPGQLVSAQGLATVVAPVTGVVRELRLGEGDLATEGQVLALLAVPRATTADGDTVAALEGALDRRRDGLHRSQQAQAQRLATQHDALQVQLQDTERELQQIDAEIATRREQMSIANDTLRRFRQLADSNFVSALQTQQQEATVLEGRAAVQALQRQSTGVRRLASQLRQQLDELPAQRGTYLAQLQLELGALEQEQVEIKSRGEYLLHSPVSGVIASQSIKVGQTVQAGQPLLSLLPGEGLLEAELLVPSRLIGFVEPGDAVLLRYDAYPYQKFGHQRARVARISRSTVAAGELGFPADSAPSGEAFYRVVLRLERQSVTAYGRQEALRPGMLVEADILGERRRLIEWVFEPLYSVRGRVEAP